MKKPPTFSGIAENEEHDLCQWNSVPGTCPFITCPLRDIDVTCDMATKNKQQTDNMRQRLANGEAHYSKFGAVVVNDVSSIDSKHFLHENGIGERLVRSGFWMLLLILKAPLSLVAASWIVPLLNSSRELVKTARGNH